MMTRRSSQLAAQRARSLRKDMTAAEVALWQLLRRSQLGVRFRRQEPIGPYIADFVCLSQRLIVEADGPHHDVNDHDVRRDAYLVRQGFRVLRIDNNDIAEHPEWVLGEIRHTLREA